MSEDFDKQQKRDAFFKKASENLAYYKLHRKIIAETLELDNWDEALHSSIRNFADTGKVSGAFFLALMEYAEKYHKHKSNETEK